MNKMTDLKARTIYMQRRGEELMVKKESGQLINRADPDRRSSDLEETLAKY
jgi:hypothetical protein